MQHGVVIVGGGIAGSALAIALARRGATITLIEREADWRPASSGIFIYSNGLQALDHLGVLDEICARGWVSRDGDNLYLTAGGETITHTTYPGIGKRIPPIVGIRRLELHRVLASAVERMGVTVRLGVTVTAIRDDHGGKPVEVTLSDGSALTCDMLVGADGIRSQIRAHLFGEIEPSYTGLGVWRSTHAKPASIDTKIMMMGVGTRLGIMPVSQDELYMFGTTAEPGKPFYPRESWPAEMRRKFGAFKGPASPLLAQVVRADQTFYTAIEEIHLPPPWSRGRVVLVGDAAHSSSPFMGQGGAMALEDALVLAEIYANTNDIPSALAAFSERRFARCKFVQDESRKVGEIGAIEDLKASVLRNERMRDGAQREVDRFYSRILEPI